MLTVFLLRVARPFNVSSRRFNGYLHLKASHQLITILRDNINGKWSQKLLITTPGLVYVYEKVQIIFHVQITFTAQCFKMSIDRPGEYLINFLYWIFKTRRISWKHVWLQFNGLLCLLYIILYIDNGVLKACDMNYLLLLHIQDVQSHGLIHWLYNNA